MTIQDIQCIAAIPQVTICSHTVSHPVLPNCRDDQIDYELRESKDRLERWTGKPVRSFAYPKGRLDGRERQFLKKYGYELAVTTTKKFARSSDDPYLMPRTDVIDDGSLPENLCHLFGVWEPVVSKIKRIINRGTGGRASLHAQPVHETEHR